MFGEVVDGEMTMNDTGSIATVIWESLPDRFPLVDLDAFVVMPNHIHGIVVINEDPTVAAQFIAPKAHRTQTEDSSSNTPTGKQGAINCAATKRGTSLGNIIRVFKAATTDTIRRSGATSFRWQNNYYDHIVRNERDLERIRIYIAANPGIWHLDHENPNYHP